MLLDPRAAGDEVADVHARSDSSKDSPLFTPDSRRAWVRLALALVIGSIGSVGMWSVVVVLPVVQAEFGATRGAVSLAFTLTMLGFGSGGVLTGKITDRFGIVVAIMLSIGVLALAYIGAVRAADGGSLALVRSLSRARGDHRRQRQLCRRRSLAADRQLGHADRRL